MRYNYGPLNVTSSNVRATLAAEEHVSKRSPTSMAVEAKNMDQGHILPLEEPRMKVALSQGVHGHWDGDGGPDGGALLEPYITLPARHQLFGNLVRLR